MEYDLYSTQHSKAVPFLFCGHDQLSPKDIEEICQLANVRIHIEQVIGATHQ